MSYGTVSAAGVIDTSATVKVNAEVKSIDADETYCLYSTLKDALTVEGDAKIDLFGAATISGVVTIPTGKTVVLGANNLTVGTDSELTVDGVIYISGAGDLIISKDVTSGGVVTKQAGKLILNNMIVGSSTDITDGTTTVYLSGFYASGDVGDYKNKSFILAPEVAATNSKTINTITIEQKTSYAGELKFSAEKNASNATIVIKNDVSFGKIILDGYTFSTDSSSNNTKITATISAITTSGESVIGLEKVSTKDLSFYVYEDDSGDDVITMFMVKTESSGTNASNQVINGNINIISGDVYVTGTVKVGTTNKDILTVESDAKLIVPENSQINIVSKTLPSGMADYAGLVVDGELSVVKGTLTAVGDTTPGKAEINGTLYMSNGTKIFAGVMIVNGTVDIETEGTDKATLQVDGSLILGNDGMSAGATPALIGAVKFNAVGDYIIAYPGADTSAALINVDSATGVSTAKITEYYINNELYMTTYAYTGTAIKDMIPTPIKITGYEDVVYSGTPANSSWYTIPEMNDSTKKLVDGDTVDSYSAVYAKADASVAQIKVSVGTGISLWIDGVKQPTGSTFTLKVGICNVEATVDPGYKGTVKITFNGVQVTDGKLVITPEMSVLAPLGSDDYIILSATGDITIDSGTTPTPTPVEPTKDDSMGITEYLLIVLVVLAAILVVVVAIRMMRS